MAKRMMIDAIHPAETRVVIADNNQIIDFDFTTTGKKQLKGNIYLAKITRVEPSLQAAFVEYGGNKQGFLPFSEIHPDYYQIPMSDRKRLMEEAERDNEEDESPATSETQPADSNEQAETTTEDTKDDSAEMAATAFEKNSLPAAITSEELPEEQNEEISAQENAESQVAAEKAGQEETAKEEAAEQAEQAAASGDADVETLPSEEEEMQRRKKKNYNRRYKIQEVVRRGQIVLVQVIKEERGNKGVSLTSYLSLAGRYCVLMPNSPKDGGISRKISSSDDRKRLKAISSELKLAEGMSVIIRTAGTDRTRAEIKRDYDYLVKVWNTIREETLKSTAPTLVYEESDVIKRAIRDQYTSDIDEIVVEGSSGFEAARDFMKLLLPSHTPKVKEYKDATPLFYAYDMEDQLLSMHDPVVKLKSGGYIVINPTEALISIDVNSGRATSERNIEETATKTNLEAAAEVARQLRLRDLAGLIVIDFIDMMESRNRRAVERTLKDALKMDRAKIQLGRISPFGLLEMSRQRLRPSISETSMVQCTHCEGRGYVRSNESMSIQMIRALEKEASTGNWNSLRLILPQAVALHLLNNKREMIKNIEQAYNLSIQILIDSNMTTSEFNLEKMRRSPTDQKPEREKGRKSGNPRKHRPHREEESTADDSATEPTATGDVEEKEEAAARPDEQGEEKRGRSRRGRRGGRRRKPAGNRNEEGQPDEVSQQPAEAAANQDSRPQREPRHSGGRNNRRRWKDEDNNNEVSRKTNDNTPSDAQSLPSFAKNAPIPKEPERPKEPEKVAAIHSMPVTPRDPNAPAKRGWWQKMIELDE